MTSSMAAVQVGEARRLDFGELVHAHQSMVFSLVYHFLHDRDLAEEVAQEVFLSLHLNLQRIQSAEHAGFWLRKVAVQRAIDETRRSRRRPQVALELVKEPSVSASPGDPLLSEVLRRLIATLAEGPRAVVILRYQEDLDPAEIADILEMPLGTVKSHLQRSLALLREKLERRGVGEI
jgi:RNA polymerase sigma-70 factor, ECF subfamily